jgi:hypothetical protein
LRREILDTAFICCRKGGSEDFFLKKEAKTFVSLARAVGSAYAAGRSVVALISVSLGV